MKMRLKIISRAENQTVNHKGIELGLRQQTYSNFPEINHSSLAEAPWRVCSLQPHHVAHVLHGHNANISVARTVCCVSSEASHFLEGEGQIFVTGVSWEPQHHSDSSDILLIFISLMALTFLYCVHINSINYYCSDKEAETLLNYYKPVGFQFSLDTLNKPI